MATWYRLEVKQIIFFKLSEIISIDEKILRLKLSLGHVQGDCSLYMGVNVKPLHTTVKHNGRFIVFTSIEANLIGQDKKELACKKLVNLLLCLAIFLTPTPFEINSDLACLM